MAKHEFGIMKTTPKPSERYDTYEPEQYDCISVHDDIEICYLLWHIDFSLGGIMEISSCKDKAKLLSIEAFSVYSSCMYKPTFDKYKSKMELLIANTSVKIFLYEVNSKIVGMLVLNNAESYPEIVGIAVHEDFRRCGIGKKLIQEVMLSEHLESVTAQTDDDAIDFYRKCGFTDERIISESTFGRMIRYNCSLVK